MLTLVYGKDWTANREYILNMLAADVAACKPNRILLVPELISHDTERRLCAVAGDTCSRFAEVVSFSRLTRRICDWSGCGMEECLDNGGRLVAIAAAARQLHSKLKAYAALETKPEFLAALVDAVDEFKRCCITSADLSAAAEQSQGAFAQKLEELALLLESYDAICQQGKRDPRDQLSWGLDRLLDSDFAQNHVFYIDGFPDFTMQNFAVISHLIQFAPHVVISMNCDKPGSESLAFTKAGDTTGKFLRIAKQNGIHVEFIEVPQSLNIISPITEKLFQGQIHSGQQNLRVLQAASIYDECVLAAEQVLELIHNGARYRDISVVCADMPTYQNTLSMYFHMCGIPVYITGTEEILEKSVIATVLTALDAAIGNLDTKDIIRYLKSALSPISLQDCDRIENYILMWGIQGQKWLTTWQMHPEGLQDVWTEDNKRTLDELNQIRELAIGPIRNLMDTFRNATQLGHQVEGLYRFFDDIHLQRRLEDLAKDLDLSGDNRSAQILSQLWDILLSALEQLKDILGQTHWDNDSFVRLFKLLLNQYDVGTIPPVLDTLMVGPVTAMRCQQVKHLIVIGAAEGKFPGYGATSGVLSDQERNALRQLGIPLTGGASEGLEIEFSEIFSCFCGASESVYISCPAGQTSFVYRRLAAMAGREYEPKIVLGAATSNPMNAAAYLGRLGEAAVAHTLGLDTHYQAAVSKSQHTLGSISRDTVNALYGNKLNLSASQVDKQADCRLAYFLQYGLRAKEQKTISVDPAEFGTYVHAVLEETAREICNMGGFKEVSLEQTMEIAQKHSEAYTQAHFSQIDSERIAYLFRRNDRELMMVVEELWAELQNSSFQPVDFEVAFGDQAQLSAIQIPGQNIQAQLRGFVDRVDAWQEDGRNYFRVVDYKTGKKDFDYCDVFNGLGLQMLLYLFALEAEGQKLLGKHPIPAGVQYFPARVPVLSTDNDLSSEEAERERQPQWKRKGLILSDEDVLFAMENADSPTRLSCRRKKDGTVTGDIASREQFKLLSKYVFRLLGKMVDDIASGNVTPNPYTRGSSHNACRFCPYGAVCHASSVEERRNYKMMSSQRFWDEIEKEMKQHE